MSDIPQENEELVSDLDLESTESEEVGLTSEETDQDGEEKKSFLSTLTVFDAMLLVALLCVSAATVLMFLELNTFGSFPSDFLGRPMAWARFEPSKYQIVERPHWGLFFCAPPLSWVSDDFGGES